MLEQLVFCKDNILRLTGFMRTALPMDLLQKDYAEQTGKNPDYFLLKYLNSKVLIEEGTTLDNILLSLEPWEEMLSVYLDVDLKAYIEEYKKEKEVENNNDGWIGIGKTISFSTSYKKSKVRKLKTDRGTTFKTESITDEINNFEMEEEYYASYYNKGSNEHYSLSDMKRNIPVYIENRVKVFEFLSDEKTNEMLLLNKDAYSLEQIEGIRFISMNKNLFKSLSFSEFLNAIFTYGFSAYSPQMIKKQREEIKEAMENLDTSKFYTSEEVNKMFEEWDKEDEEDESKDEETILREIKEKRESKSPEEKTWYDYESERIEAIKERIGPKDKRVFRTESLINVKPPEHRLFGMILDKKD